MKLFNRRVTLIIMAGLLFYGWFGLSKAWASEGNIDTTDKYAWSENAGWHNFRPTNGGVTVHETYLSGYAWAENIGWVKLGSGTGPYGNTNNTNWGVNRDSGTGTLSGYAWSEIAGWINFDSTNSQVATNTTNGSFDGYAWAENIGWIHFKYDDPAYNVKVATTAPTVTTSAASSVTTTTASGGGNVTSDGGLSVTARGVCWSTSANPTVALSTKTTDGTGTGTFTSSITGLSPNTTYHIRAYATNSDNLTGYGSDLTFTTSATAPTVTTSAASSVTTTTASGGGNVTSDGGLSVTARGVCWSTSANPTVALSTKTTDGTGTGTFTSSITGLSPNTTYHIRAYATNSDNLTGYGSDLTFTTSATAPTVTTSAASSVTTTTASGGGNVTSDGGLSVTARGVCWSTSANPTVALSTKTTDGTGTGTFTSSITGLSPNTTYHIRAYATNSDNLTGYGSDLTFTTSATAPTVTTSAASSVTTTTASGGGNVTSDGGLSVTARGVCWSTSANPTVALSTKTTDGTGTGTFTSSITGLSPNTTYHIRAYATNSDNLTGYGSDKTFTTAAPAGTYFVNIATGNDSNDGSSALPWKTLHHAITQINGGTAGTYVLHVALGTYNVSGNTREADEEIVLSQSDVTIIGESGSAPIIDGTGAQNWINGIEITGSYVTIENLYFTGFTGTEKSGIKVSSGSESSNNEVRKCRFYGNDRGVWVNHSNGTTIRNCEIYQNTTHGIDITWSTGQVVVGNKVYNNPQYGIRAQCSPEISRNLIYDNVYGIMVEANGTGDDSSPTIKNNVIYKTASGAMSYGIYTLASNGLADPEIYHNTIDSGTISGIATEKTGGSSGPNIRYNIITNFGQYGIQNIGTSPTINYNNVWNNTAGNYEGCTAGANDLDPPGNPLYVTGSYSLRSTSPCIGTIPSGDPVTLDYPGFKRPLSGKTMGAYEYVADVTNNYTLPGGTGVSTDYRIFTIPLELGTGADMLTAMENVLGAYDPVHWRAFLFNGTSYNEFNSTQFASHTIKPGMGFWIITTYTDVIPFKGQPAPDGVDYVMDLGPGWHLIGLPWVDTNIFLSSIKVTDGVYTYALSDVGNNLTQKILWDFTGDGPFSGYEKRSAVGFRLQNNKGYFFKVLSSTPIRMIIPNAANLAQNAPVDMLSNQTNTNEDDETPPPPPGAEPTPDIKANGQDGPVVLNAGDSVAVSVSMGPGVWNGRNADWWVAAHTPFTSPWYTYVYPEGWKSGIQACVQMPLFELSGPINVLNMVLPTGSYTFYFAVDGNMDGKPDVTWMDSVQVSVE